MAEETRALRLTLDQAVTLLHHIMNVRSNPQSLEKGCCLDAATHPIRDLECLVAIDEQLGPLLDFEGGEPRWADPPGKEETNDE